MLKTFAKDLLRYVPSKVVPGIFGIFVIPLITRLFDPNEYGQYVIVTSTVSILGIVAIDWISTSIIRFYASYERTSELELFNGTVIRIVVLSVFIVYCTSLFALTILKPRLDPSLHHYLNVGLLIFALGAFFNIMLQILVVKRKPTCYSLMSIWRQCGCIMLGIAIVVLYNRDVASLLWGILFGIVIMLPILFRTTFEKFSLKAFSPRLFADSMRYGFPLLGTNLAGWILALSDRYMIEHFRSSHEVGLYSISYSLADRSIQMIVSLMIFSSAPIVMKLWETRGVAETRIFIRDLTKYYMIITLPAAVGLSLLAKPVLQLLTTQSFYEGYKVMPLVAGSIFLFGLQRNFQLGLLLYKKTHLIMYVLLISGLTNIALNICFVPRYGFIAAGYTTLFSYMIFAVLIILISRRYFIFEFPFNTLLKVLSSLVVMSLVLLGISALNLKSLILVLLLSITLGGIFYFLSLVIMKEIGVNTMKMVLKLFKNA